MDTRIELLACCGAAIALFVVIGIEPALLLPPAALALLAGAWCRFGGPDRALGP